MGDWSRDSISATVGSKHLHCDRPVPATTYNFSVNALNSMGESGYADNNSVHTITSEEWEGAIHEEDPFGEDTRGLLLYQTVIMAVVGGAPLLALNWLGCQLTESKGSVSDGKKSEGNGFTVSTASGSTRYEVRELVNPAAQRTLLIDSGRAPTTTTPPVTTAPLSTPTPREHKGKMAATTHWRP